MLLIVLSLAVAVAVANLLAFETALERATCMESGTIAIGAVLEGAIGRHGGNDEAGRTNEESDEASELCRRGCCLTSELGDCGKVDGR